MNVSSTYSIPLCTALVVPSYFVLKIKDGYLKFYFALVLVKFYVAHVIEHVFADFLTNVVPSFLKHSRGLWKLGIVFVLF